MTQEELVDALHRMLQSTRRVLCGEIKTLPAVLSLDDLPYQEGIYFCSKTDDANVAYVGSSSMLRTRWRSHKLTMLFQLGMVEVRWKPRELGMGYIDIRNEEEFYISILRPEWNISPNGIERTYWSEHLDQWVRMMHRVCSHGFRTVP